MLHEKILKKYSEGIDDFLGIHNCIKIANNIPKFKKWLNLKYAGTTYSDYFEGHKLFIESLLRTLLRIVSYNSSLGLTEDQIYVRARHCGIPLNKVPNTCEKIILIKNLELLIRKIRKSKLSDFEKISKELETKVIEPFDNLLDTVLMKKTEKIISDSDGIILVSKIYLSVFMNQMNHGLPWAYCFGGIDHKISSPRYKKAFLGYKVSLEFLWSHLMGLKPFEKILEAKIKLIKGWDRHYYPFPGGNPLKNDDEDFNSINTFIIKTILDPEEKKAGMTSPIDQMFSFSTKPNKKKLSGLIKTFKPPKLSEREKMDIFLLWYPIQLLDTSKSHIFNGVPAFATVLLGAIELKNMGWKHRVCVRKFKHPHQELRGNDYSYAVLIESYGSIGSDFSGWLLFEDCCGDYSGFAGQEHAVAESLLRAKTEDIDIKETTVTLEKFKKYISKFVILEGSDSAKRANLDLRFQLNKEKAQNKEFVDETKGIITELITYYTQSKSGFKEYDWNIPLPDDKQLDVTAETNEQKKLIECKYNPNNYDMLDEIQKLKKKMEQDQSTKLITGEFWFWILPSEETSNLILNSGLKLVDLSKIVDQNRIWTNKKTKNLKNILNKNQNKANS